VAEPRERRTDDELAVLGRKADRAADPRMHRRVRTERHEPHPVEDVGLDQHVLAGEAAGERAHAEVERRV
jgi:hypothetical protein